MKPIFKEEWIFLKSNGIDIPENCWREKKTIYLNCDRDTKILTIKINHGKMEIDKDFRKDVLNKYKNYTFKEEVNIPENKYRINKLFKESVGKTVACLLKYKDYNWRISDSTGKDSLVSAVIFLKARSILKDKKGINSSFDVDFFNTSNDTA